MDEIHSKWCRYLRYVRHINQQQLAKLVTIKLKQAVPSHTGIDPSVICRIESGKRNPTESVWQAMADVAGVTLSTYWKGPPV